MRKNAKRCIVGGLLVMLIAGGAFWAYNLNPERRLGCFRNEHARCVGCGCFISSAMEQFLMEKKDGWLPRGGVTPADSLTQLSPWMPGGGPGTFASHALSSKLYGYWKERGTLTYDYMCCRYNEGLRADDPQDLIVMYYYKPTRWADNESKRAFVGRPIMTLTLDRKWDFIPEDEFQTRQKQTEEYLVRRSNRITKPSTATSNTTPSAASEAVQD